MVKEIGDGKNQCCRYQAASIIYGGIYIGEREK